MKHNSSVFLTTNGCPENRMDLARMQEFFRQNGWEIKDHFRDADLILFNSCGLTQGTEEHSINIINHIKATKRPDAEFIVCGCLPKINLDRINEVYSGITFGSDDVDKLDEMFACENKARDIHANYLMPRFQFDGDIAQKTKTSSKKRVFVNSLKLVKRYSSDRIQQKLEKAINVYDSTTYPIKISTGCLNACAFCGVKLSRGNVRSKSVESIKREFEEGVKKNHKEFSLIGTDVGAYGRDLGINLVSLLRELVKIEGDYKIRLRNMQPRYLMQLMSELREILQTGKISYLSSAAESGNNRILRLMNRGYTVEEYKELIRTLNTEFPEIQIRTQLMVGFPTETEEEFRDTMRLLDELSFDYAEIYTFQPRPGTRASEMDGQIPRSVNRKRYYRLLRKSLFKNIKRKRKAINAYKNRLKATA
jgi:tRNA A37 methylthiotransferase MiaB